jgi:hypothetical protein
MCGSVFLSAIAADAGGKIEMAYTTFQSEAPRTNLP